MKIVIYGACGHGRVVADIVVAMGRDEVVGFIDDNAALHNSTVGKIPVLGGQEVLRDMTHKGVEGVIVAIGGNEARLRQAGLLASLGFQFATAIHPSAVLAKDVDIGVGTVVMPGVVVNAAARIGSHVVINTSATIDHDCVLEDACHISPGTHLAGHVTVKKGSHVGIGACAIQKVTIGEWATVGAGAVVIRDVPSGTTVVGNPAKQLVRHA